MNTAMTRSAWVALVTMALLAAAAPARAQATAIQQESLRLSVCLNDWDSAIAQASQLEQAPGLPVKTQAELVLFRRQMQLWRQDQTAVAIPGCEAVLAGFGLPGYSGRPLDIAGALYASIGLGSAEVVSDQATRQEEALWQAGLGVTADTPLGSLPAAQRINTRTGSGVSTGAVSRRVDVYAFLGAQGDAPSLDLTVIQQRPGLLYTDDQALLFVFDANGRLLGEARTEAGAQPYLPGVTLPTTGVYYAAVTTPQHRPVLDASGLITGWQGIGTSAVTYTLTLRDVTPSPQLGIGGR
ncbi:MAG TPA: hypothetical protein VLS96_20490 [Nodosilinea sp.]|nr:hypothetical protein [Nodosilinea sp.]